MANPEQMWLMMQQDKPGDFVIGTGEAHSVRELCDVAFGRLDLDYTDHVHIDPRYFRPTEVETLLGDPSKAKKVLGWESTTPFEELVKEMVAADHEEAKRDALVREAGYKTFDYHE